MKITTKIHFNRRGRLKKDGSAPIEVETYYNSSRVFMNTGVYILPKYWSKTQCKVVKLSNADHLNKTLLSILKRIEKYEVFSQENETPISLQELRDFIFLKTTNSSSLVAFARDEIDASTLELGSVKRNKSVINTFELLFDDLAISQFDYTKLLEYNKRLKTERNLGDNTIIGHHKTINKFLNIALKKEIIKYNPYRDYSIGSYTSTREAITFEEVKKIEELYIPVSEQVLQQVTDMFLFCCFTGLRFSDMQALSKSEIVDTEKGYRIRYKMEKVDRVNEMPLYSLFDGKPEQLLKKYIDSKSEIIFPKITNQAMNRNLKSLALAIGARVKLTSHIARHTFGTMLADLTQNPYLIMQLMGHSDIKTSMIYIHLSQKRLNLQLEKVIWTL